MQKVMSLDFETKNTEIDETNVVWSLTISYDGKKTQRFVNCNGLKRGEIPKQVIKDLEDERIIKIAQNGVFDGAIAAYFFGIFIKNWWDVMLSEIVIQGVALPATKKKSRSPAEQKLFAAHGVALEDILPRYKLGTLDKTVREAFINRPLGIPFTKKELKYMDDDVLPLIKLQRMQEYILTRDELLEVALLENKYLEKNIRRKVIGIGFDPSVWKRVALENGKEYEKRLAKLPREVDNWNSEKQVKAYFRRRHNINIPCYKSKSPDVDDLDTLYLKTRNKVLGDFILMRELHKSVTSYGLNWFKPDKKGVLYVKKDGRVRPDITQIKETGRTSMQRPNLQQLPGHGRKDYEHELVMRLLYAGDPRAKPQHRRAFIPRPGHVFVINDFSGQEIGVMAAASGEKLWINAMLRGEAVHALTASLLYQLEWTQGATKKCSFPKKCKCPEHITPYERAKIINFQQAYGGGPSRFSKSTGLPIFESKVTVAKYRRITPYLTKYLDKNARMAVSTGESYSADPYRRRRVLRGDQKWRIENQGKNNPIQAAGANMLKLASISVPDKYYSPLEIHDEIILEVKISEALAAAKLLKNVMEKSADYITSIKGLIRSEPKIQYNLMKDLPVSKIMSSKKVKNGEECFIPKIK